MRNSFATKVLSIAMILVFPAAMLMAETGNTVLYASGTVTLNGKEVARSASVASGDKIETAGATATALSQDGSKVTVSPYSAVRYQGDAVNVVRGTAAINTTGGMSAQAAQITVTPKDKGATYEIARLNNNVVITSHTGALMITEAGAGPCSPGCSGVPGQRLQPRAGLDHRSHRRRRSDCLRTHVRYVRGPAGTGERTLGRQSPGSRHERGRAGGTRGGCSCR